MLASGWSNETVDEAKIGFYTATLFDVSYAQAERAAIVHCRRSAFYPKPADILKIVAEQETGDQLSPGEAWRLVEIQINGKGYQRYHEWEFDDPAVAEAVRTVGPQRICLEDRSKGDFVRPAFDKALHAAQERQRRIVQDGASSLGGSNVTALPGRAAS